MTEPSPTAMSSSSTTTTPSKPNLLISKPAYREVERNSSTIFAIANTSKGSHISRLSLVCNELLREICQRKVEKTTIDQLDFYLRDQRLKEEDADAMVYLAKSIRSIAQSIGGFDGRAQSPAHTIKPPLDFGDGEGGLDNMLLAVGESRPNRKRVHDPNALFHDDMNNDDDDSMVGSGPKAVGAENDFTVVNSPISIFRPLTPEDQIRDDPSPPPSPTIKSMFNKKRRYDEHVEDEGEDEEDDQVDQQSSVTSPPAPNKANYRCPMCDTCFYVQHQLNSHLVSYHRVSLDNRPFEVKRHSSGSSATAQSTRPMQQSTARSTAIVTSRPLNGFISTRPTNGSAINPGMQMRLSSTMVTSPGGTIREYSSPSNAARAAAKAAAAAAAGVMRPNAPAKPYTCRQCGVLLASQQMYASHVRYNHPKERTAEDGASPAVKKSSSDRNRETAIVHLQLEDGTKAFQCRRCEKVFDSAQKVAGHSRHCLLVFEGKARPPNQGPIPTEDRPYTVYRCGLGSELARTCPYCGELLPSIRKVDKHVRQVHEADRHEVYGCTTCDRRFVTLGGIENHWLHYGDCPHGVLTVHRDGLVTCADIGEIPPQLKRPQVIIRSGKDDEDPSVQIVNTILGLHGFKVKSRGAPQLSPEMDGHAVSYEDDDEAAPELEEEMLDDDSPMDEEEFLDSHYGTGSARNDAIVSMKVIPCRSCNFASRTREAMDMHMAEEHPDEVLAGASSGTDDEERHDSRHHRHQNGSATKTKQTGEMRRMLSSK